jgi:hypothetical protein
MMYMALWKCEFPFKFYFEEWRVCPGGCNKGCECISQEHLRFVNFLCRWLSLPTRNPNPACTSKGGWRLPKGVCLCPAVFYHLAFSPVAICTSMFLTCNYQRG